jgi:hypothetical protein
MPRNLPDWLDGFMTLTENSEPPKMFRKWAGISTIAAALQRKVRIELGLSLTFYPNLYIVLVGPSATGKGTAMKFASDIIEQVPTIRVSAQATTLQALIRRMKETNLTDVDLVTGEQQFHSSLTIFSTEFTVFLGYHNRELIAALCEWYDCHSRWTYETISRKKEEVVGVWVNLIAGTTHDSIQSSLPIESIGAGLTSRIIFICEEAKEKLVIEPTKTEEEIILQQKLINDLESIAMLSGKLEYTKEFSEFYREWCIEADRNPPFHDKKFDGYCGRRRKHLLTLAMICNASRSDGMMMDIEDIQRAAIFLAESEIKMGRVFKGMGRSDISSLINDAITFLITSKVPDVPLWQFAKHFEGDMDKFTMDKVIVTLEAMNFAKIIKRPGTDSVIHVLETV